MLSLTQVTLSHDSDEDKKEIPFFLEPLNMEIKSGTVLGLVGPNGAGKTSMLNAIAGIGNVLGSRTIDGKQLSAGVSKQLTFVASEPILIEKMSVIDFLIFDASVREVNFTKQDVKAIMDKFDCTGFATKKSKLVR